MQTVEGLLGTRAEVSVSTAAESSAGSDDESDDGAERCVLAEVARLESVFSVFDERSALWEFRQAGSTDSEELHRVTQLADSWTARTNGAFHPAIQPLIDRWDQAEADGVVPSPEDLAVVAHQIQARPERAHLNLNAIAKGWIADRALASLSAWPKTTAAWLSLGGDLVHWGQGAVAVGIEDPHRPYDNVKPLATVEVSNEALATSGGTRRWWTIEGHRYSKVLDPRSGQPVGHIAGATVVAADGATADALATIAVILDPAETLALTDELGGHCFLVTSNGDVMQSASNRFRPSPTR